MPSRSKYATQFRIAQTTNHWKQSGLPSGANKAAIDRIVKDQDISIVIRQVKYLNNIVEQDHRAIKRITRPMLGFQSFQAAKNGFAGIALMHMIRKGQLMMEDCSNLNFADQFYALAGQFRPA